MEDVEIEFIFGICWNFFFKVFILGVEEERFKGIMIICLEEKFKFFVIMKFIWWNINSIIIINIIDILNCIIIKVFLKKLFLRLWFKFFFSIRFGLKVEIISVGIILVMELISKVKLVM